MVTEQSGLIVTTMTVPGAGCVAVIRDCTYLGSQPHTGTDALPPDSCCLILVRSGTILGHSWHG